MNEEDKMKAMYFIKGLRIDIHKLETELDKFTKEIAKDLARIINNPTKNLPQLLRRANLAHDKISEGRMWLGKCLQSIGSELPPEYRDDGSPKE